MKVTKFKRDYKRKKIPDLVVFAENVLGCYRKHPALQGPKPDFLPTDAAVDQSITSLKGSYAAGLGGSKDSKKQRDVDLHVVMGHLDTLAHYYETGGSQNHVLLLNTGFEEITIQRIVVPKTLGAVAAPALRHGSHPGVIYAKVPRVPYAKGYEVFYTDGDPTVEDNFRYHGTHYRPSEIEIAGCEGGKVYSIKIRAANTYGKGPFSPIGTIRAL